MTTFAESLKNEIARLARKEIRTEIDGLKKASSRYRTEIASLKKQISDLQKKLGKASKPAATPLESETAPRHRFSAEGLKKFRLKMELSGQALANLLEVSLPSIYSWEAGKSRPRSAQLEKISALRKLSKKELQSRLAD